MKPLVKAAETLLILAIEMNLASAEDTGLQTAGRILARMDSLVPALIMWITVETGLKAPDPPQIIKVPAEQLASMTGGTANPQAIYKYEERTIYFPNNWTPETLENKAILVHELAHHVIKMNNVQALCERALEAESYRLEFKWLSEQGIQDPYDFLQTNELAILLRSACRD